MNFIAFEFCDNDFHSPLREAIEYVTREVVEGHHNKELTAEEWREFVLRAMVLYNELRRIWWKDEYRGGNTVNYREYFEGLLRVTFINNAGELRSGFDGYLYDVNLETVVYYAN